MGGVYEVSMEKQAGLKTCVAVWIFCAVLLVPLSVVGHSWRMLGESILRYGLISSVPNGYALYLLGFLVALTGIKWYVERLRNDARERALQLWDSA